MAALLRVASLPDHQFILNHILRCPSGVAQWAIGYIQPLSPLHYKGVVRQNNNNHDSKCLLLHFMWHLPLYMYMYYMCITVQCRKIELILGYSDNYSLYVTDTLVQKSLSEVSFMWRLLYTIRNAIGTLDVVC